MQKRIFFAQATGPGIFRGFLTADKGGGGGGGKPLSIEEKLEKALSDLGDSKANIAALTKERDDAGAESATLKTQFDALTSEAGNLRAANAAMAGERDAARAELAAAKASLASASANVARLESLCQIKGIDPKSAVPPTPEHGAQGAGSEHPYDRWVKASGPEKFAIYGEHKAEIRAEAKRRESAAK